MAKKTIVVLEILDDNEERPWWEALCLPEPWRWSTDSVFAPQTHIKPVLEEVVVR